MLQYLQESYACVHVSLRWSNSQGTFWWSISCVLTGPEGRGLCRRHSPCSREQLRALGPPKGYASSPSPLFLASAGGPFWWVDPFPGTLAAPPSPEVNPISLGQATQQFRGANAKHTNFTRGTLIREAYPSVPALSDLSRSWSLRSMPTFRKPSL